MVEQNTVKALKSELCECKQDNERLLKSLDDVQKEVLQLRYVIWHCLCDVQPASPQAVTRPFVEE